MPFRSMATLPVLLVLAACQSSSPGDAARAAAVVEVRAAVESLMGAMNAHDAEAVLAHYEQSPEFTYIGVTEVRTGWDRFARTVAPWYDRHADVTFEFEVVRARALGPDVVLTVTRGSSTEAPTLLWSHVWSRAPDGAWRVAQEHEAWPEAEPPPAAHPR